MNDPQAGNVVAFTNKVVRRLGHDADTAQFRAEVISVKHNVAIVRKIDKGNALLFPIIKLHRAIPVANLIVVKPDGQHIWID
jgi:hypothetical protein